MKKVYSKLITIAIAASILEGCTNDKNGRAIDTKTNDPSTNEKRFEPKFPKTGKQYIPVNYGIGCFPNSFESFPESDTNSELSLTGIKYVKIASELESQKPPIASLTYFAPGCYTFTFLGSQYNAPCSAGVEMIVNDWEHECKRSIWFNAEGMVNQNTPYPAEEDFTNYWEDQLTPSSQYTAKEDTYSSHSYENWCYTDVPSEATSNEISYKETWSKSVGKGSDDQNNAVKFGANVLVHMQWLQAPTSSMDGENIYLAWQLNFEQVNDIACHLNPTDCDIIAKIEKERLDVILDELGQSSHKSLPIETIKNLLPIVFPTLSLNNPVNVKVFDKWNSISTGCGNHVFLIGLKAL